MYINPQANNAKKRLQFEIATSFVISAVLTTSFYILSQPFGQAVMANLFAAGTPMA